MTTEVIDSFLPTPASPRVARMGGLRPFVTVALGRVEGGVPSRPLLVQLEGEERAFLELVDVEDLAVSVSARSDANHGGPRIRKDRAKRIPNMGGLYPFTAPSKQERGRHWSWGHGQTPPPSYSVAAEVDPR
jgi:hypothetical protein